MGGSWGGGGGGGVLAASGFCNLETVERWLLLHCVDLHRDMLPALGRYL